MKIFGRRAGAEITSSKASDAERSFSEQLLDRYAGWLRIEKGLLEQTVQTYLRELRALRGAAGDLERLSTDEIRTYIQARGGASATTSRRLATFASFYGFLVLTDYRPDDPTVKLSRPKQRKRMPRPLERPEERFLALDATAQLVAIVLLETGLRISEACALRLPVPAPDQLIVRGKGDKDRIIPLPDRARLALDWLGGKITFDPVTQRPLSKRTIQRRFQEAGFTPHRLRHTFGTQNGAAGVDLGVLQDLMGHASPTTTRVYTMYDMARFWDAVDRRERHRNQNAGSESPA